MFFTVKNGLAIIMILIALVGGGYIADQLQLNDITYFSIMLLFFIAMMFMTEKLI